MKHINKFNESSEVQLNMYNHLTDKEIKLLLLLLEDLVDMRGNMGCNDPSKEEENIFTKDERMEMNRFLGQTDFISEEDADDNDDYMYNFYYPQYLLEKLKSQL